MEENFKLMRKIFNFLNYIQIWRVLLVIFYLPALFTKLAMADSKSCCPRIPPPAEKKNLTRTADPIIIPGQTLKALLGKPIENIRIYAAPRGVLIPIPYQIDERDSTGKLVLPQGAKPTKDTDQEYLDANDEIVLMAKDLGDRIFKENWVPGFEIGLEIEVQDPLTNYKGWAYAFYFATPPARSLINYVRYTLNSRESTISTDTYLVSSPPEKAYYRKLLVTKVGGGNGKNLLQRSRIEGQARLDWFFLLGALKTFKRDEEDITLKIDAYKDGPVRVILRGKPELELIWGIKLPSEEVDSVYYGNQFYTTNAINTPVKLSRYCSEASVLGTLDFNQNALGMKFYNSRNLQGVVLDGVMSEAEKNLDQGPQEWSVVTGKPGTILTRLKWGATLSQLKSKLYYLDTTKSQTNPKTSHPHMRIGYLFDLLPVDKGRHLYQIYFYFPPSYQPGEETAYLNITDNPLKVSIQQEINLGMRLPEE